MELTHRFPETVERLFVPAATRNLASCRLCWPEWQGPKVSDDPDDPDGYCQDGGCGQHYCAPIRITAVDETAVHGVICYGPDAPQHCRDQNGSAHSVELGEIWPPVEMLWERRNAEQVAAAIDAGKTCGCGGKPAHVYGNSYECEACRKARLASYSTPTKRKKK